MIRARAQSAASPVSIPLTNPLTIKPASRRNAVGDESAASRSGEEPVLSCVRVTRRVQRAALSLLFSASFLASLPAAAQRLPDLVQAALSTDPAVAGAEAQLRAAEQRVVQARAGFGPSAAITANSTDTRYREGPDFELRPFHAKQLALQITQPLLRLTLLPTLDAALAQVEQARAGLEQARAESAHRLVEAAFELLKSRDALSFVQAQRIAASEQQLAAQGSYKIGTAPITDVRDAQAKADTVAAQMLAAEADLELKQQIVAELAGSAAPGLMARAIGGDRLPTLQPASVPEWLAAAQDRSGPVRQALQALAIADAEVRKAGQGHVPTADVTYSYTMNKDTGTTTSFFPRRGDSSAVALNVNIPLFTSGATQSKVRESRALRDKAQADLETARRSVSLGVRQTFSAALSAVGQARGLETAVKSQELALRANRRGYEVGMKTNAEVLESQSRLFEARRDLSRARYDAWIGYAKLKALAGMLGESDVAELEGLLVDAAPLTMFTPQRPKAVEPK